MSYWTLAIISGAKFFELKGLVRAVQAVRTGGKHSQDSRAPHFWAARFEPAAGHAVAGPGAPERSGRSGGARLRTR